MEGKVRSGLLFFGVTGGMVLLATFSFVNNNGLRDSQVALSGLADRWQHDVCMAGTATLKIDGGIWCVDMFPASPSLGCLHQNPRAPLHTAENLAVSNCFPESQEGVLPWSFVNREQAEQLCGRVGKSLLPGQVWYQAALGTPSESCNVSSNMARINATSECRSEVGVFDMVGNVWEFVSETAKEQTVAGSPLPASGYVAMVDEYGWPRSSTSTPQEQFDGDRVWSDPTIDSAVMRGGFYDSGSAAGVNTLHAAVGLDFSSAATGFRCGYRL